MTEVILEAENLIKVYAARRGLRRRIGPPAAPRRPALADVSIRLERGQVLGVVGESGSGKTTLARCLSLLVRPDSGRVLLQGDDFSALSARQLRARRRAIQVIFQDPYASLNPRLTVGDALGEVLHVHKLVAEDRISHRVEELLDLVGLPAAAMTRYPSDFSGGQRQRICIARALAAEPLVLIADEAVSALDVSIQAQIVNLLLTLRSDLGLSMIFISHDLHVVRRIAPNVVVMFAGRVVEVLPADAPLEAAEHPYTRALVAAVPRLETMTLPAVPDSEAGSALTAQGCPFRGRCPRATELCAAVDPELRETPRGGAVACHHLRGV